MNNVLIITAAGSGQRMGVGKNKLLLNVNGKSIILRCLEAFDGIKDISKIIITVSSSDVDEFKRIINRDDVEFVIGGSTRQESIFNAIKTINSADYVIIHDGARPFVKKDDIYNVINDAIEYGAAVLGVKVKDTIKIVNDDLMVNKTPNRECLFSVQTPQVFSLNKYKENMELAVKEKMDFTDDSQLFELCNMQVKITIGSYDNIKITTPEDINLAENIVKMNGE